MPGSVSDSYDPEFGTTQNAEDVKEAIKSVVDKISEHFLTSQPLKNILEVVHGTAGRLHAGPLSEREWRIIRFSLNRAIETI